MTDGTPQTPPCSPTRTTPENYRRPTDDQLHEARAIALRVANRYLEPASGLADDVAQATLVKFVDIDLHRAGNWRAWVNRVARNEAIDHLRREKTHWWGVTDVDASPSAPPKPLREVGPSAAGMWPQIITKLTETLGDREREMLLASLDGASNDDIARVFGYANGRSVAVILTRARAKVRAAFTDRQEVLELLGTQRLY
jgi:RNA polymerase sigma factor (sigma-70 family)